MFLLHKAAVSSGEHVDRMDAEETFLGNEIDPVQAGVDQLPTFFFTTGH